jgi:hypothetical protein
VHHKALDGVPEAGVPLDTHLLLCPVLELLVTWDAVMMEGVSRNVRVSAHVRDLGRVGHGILLDADRESGATLVHHRRKHDENATASFGLENVRLMEKGLHGGITRPEIWLTKR